MPSQSPILLGHREIDADHAAFSALLAEVASAPDVAFATVFRRLVEHTIEHFGRENALMVRSGFPALREHQGEHERVLGELHQFLKRVERGLIPFGRAYVRETLPPWFELHARTMDSALAAHLAR
jgi:hemerythrin